MKTRAFTKSFGSGFSLEMPSLELPQGQITAVIGPNGSGKSTFARILAGLERTDDGAPVLTDARAGYMPQKSFAFRMSTEKNVLLGGGDPARAAELMRAIGIDGLAAQSAKKLSGGETARMALCRILMGRYDLLILDEPTASMDMESTLAAEGLIRGVCEEQGCALVLITHSISQARRIADRILVLGRGQLVEEGSCAQVLDDPREERTKRFLEFYGV